MKKLFCILFTLFCCFSFAMAEDESDLEYRLNYEKELEEWKEKQISHWNEYEKDDEKYSCLTPGTKFLLLVVNDVCCAGEFSSGLSFKTYLDGFDFDWCEIVEIKPESKDVFKIVFSQVKELEHDYEAHYYDRTEQRSLNSIQLQYKTIYVSKYDEIKIIYYKPCLEWMYTLPSIEGTIKSGTFNKIDLNVTNSFLRFSYGIDGYSGYVNF